MASLTVYDRGSGMLPDGADLLTLSGRGRCEETASETTALLIENE